MAYSYVWPTSLPQTPQKGYTESGGVNIISTSMDSGPAKRRYRSKSTNTLNVSFVMSTSQVSDFTTFIDTTVKGVSRFGFTHPRTKAVVETRIVPQSGSDLYNIAYLAPEYWTVSFKLEILP
jgi:hypothetical protein